MRAHLQEWTWSEFALLPRISLFLSFLVLELLCDTLKALLDLELLYALLHAILLHAMKRLNTSFVLQVRILQVSHEIRHVERPQLKLIWVH